MLAEAMCKLMGYRYVPSEETYWIHGISSETNFLYVTTQRMMVEQLAFLEAEVGEKRSLLVCCGAYPDGWQGRGNVMVKKIPKVVLNKCEWGKDDYSLNVKNLSNAPVEEEECEEDIESKPLPLFKEE